MKPTTAEKLFGQRVGRYAIFDQIAAGGMATVHLAKLAGPAGFSRVVAAKRLHPHLVHDGDFKAMFLDEARLAARVRHPNVVPILDVIHNDEELILIMEYVHGDSLLGLLRLAREKKRPAPLGVCVGIMVGVLHGLHAAHEATNEKGELLGLVHRDVSPQNILVGVHGVARVLDFGVAKAMQASDVTRPGLLKGKLSYMAPEVFRGQPLTRQVDVFSAAVVFWELLTRKKLFSGSSEQERMIKILNGDYPKPSLLVPELPRAIDSIVMKGLHTDPARRYATADEMAVELENCFSPASPRIVGQWVGEVAAELLERRAELMQQVEISEIETITPEGASDSDLRALRLPLGETKQLGLPFDHEAEQLGLPFDSDAQQLSLPFDKVKTSRPPGERGRAVLNRARTELIRYASTLRRSVERLPRSRKIALLFGTATLVAAGALFWMRPRPHPPAASPEAAPALVAEPVPEPSPAPAPVASGASGELGTPADNPAEAAIEPHANENAAKPAPAKVRPSHTRRSRTAKDPAPNGL